MNTFCNQNQFYSRYIKNIALLILLFSIAGCKNKNQEKPHNGEYKEYFENGDIKSKRNYKDGKEEGKWEEYFENGSIKSIGYYKGGKKEGKWEEYEYDGQLNCVGSYHNGKKDGKWKVIFFFNTLKVKQISEGSYKEGVKDGFWTEYEGTYSAYSYVGSYKNGKREGEWKTLFNNEYQRPKLIVEYKNGLLDGMFKEFDEEKKVFKEIGEFEKGKRIGIWKEEAYDKESIRIGNYINDKREGEWNEYYTKSSNREKEGDLKSTMNYINDKYDGEYKYYSEGFLWLIGEFSEGKRCCSWSIYDRNEILIAKCTYFTNSDGTQSFDGWEHETAKRYRWDVNLIRTWNFHHWPEYSFRYTFCD